VELVARKVEMGNAWKICRKIAREENLVRLGVGETILKHVLKKQYVNWI